MGVAVLNRNVRNELAERPIPEQRKGKVGESWSRGGWNRTLKVEGETKSEGSVPAVPAGPKRRGGFVTSRKPRRLWQEG